MMRKATIRAAGFLAFFLLPLHGAVAQLPSINQAPTDPHPRYSPTTTVQAQSSIELKSNKYSGAVCVVFTELSRFPTPSPPQGSIDYGLFSANGASRLSVNGSPASAQETLSGAFPPKSKMNDTMALDFLVEIFPTSLPPLGTHAITLRADLYADAYPPSGGVVDTIMFNISILVGTYYDVSVVPSGGAFSLSSTTAALAFGTLQPNDSRGADILVKSNISYSLSLSSVNGCAFKNVSDGSRLPYSLAANGSPVSLSPGIKSLIASGAPAGYGTPARYALLVTVLPFSVLPTEGAYADTITVTLSAP